MNTHKLIEEEICLICDNENKSNKFFKCDKCKKTFHQVNNNYCINFKFYMLFLLKYFFDIFKKLIFLRIVTFTLKRFLLSIIINYVMYAYLSIRIPFLI